MFTLAKNAEAKLLEVASTLQENPDGYYAIHFNFSRLQEGQRSDYQIKIAVNILRDLFKEEEGGVFICQDNDVYFLYKGTNRALIEKAIFQLRYLFADDPLAYTVADRENEDFCAVYDLQFQCYDFIADCKQKATSTATSEREGHAADSSIPSSVQNILALSPKNLAQVEAELGRMDIKLALRKQPVCAVVEGKPIRPLFYEIYIHIAHLQRLLPAQINLKSNPALFRYITEVLDMQVLSLIKHQPRYYFRESGSLNLNISSILSKSFEDFTAILSEKIRNSIIIEIAITDIFANFPAFQAAFEFLKKHGYRTCIDETDSLSFPFIDRNALGFDLVKLRWNADIHAQINNYDNDLLTQAIQHCGASRVILCHCDSKYAIDYGKELGISLYQGRHLDKILNPDARIEN